MDEEKIEEVEVETPTAEQIENLLITEGVMIPGQELVHYMTRNASYMRLIESEQFKESGIKLEEVLDDEFIRVELEKNSETTKMLRFVTEKIVELMDAVPKDTDGTEEVVDA